jgi:hypothetical protein
MKPFKFIASVAVILLSMFGVAGARAQLVTNSVTINILFIPQGPTNIVDGTNNFYAPAKTSSHNAAWFVHEIGTALHAEQGANLSSAAKLVLLTGSKQGPLFAIIDGTNFYGLTNIMGLLLPLRTTVVSGIQNGNTDLSFPSLRTVEMAQIGFNDVSILGDNGLQFILQGLITTKVTDTQPAAATGNYTESVSGEVIDLVGGITQSNNIFYATGKMSFSGKGNLVWVPK